MQAKNPKTAMVWRVAARISFSYALVASVWIYASDHLLAPQAACPPALRSLQSYNGWLFVGVTAVLLYGLIGSLVMRSQRLRPPAADLGSAGRTESAFVSSSGWPGTCTPPEAVWLESQTLLQALIEGTSDAIYVKDRHGRYRLLNQAVTRITGKSAAEVIGQDDTVLFPLDEARQVMAGDRRVLAGKTTVTYEETVTTASGEKRTYLSTKGVIIDPQGEARGLFGIARDITARKQAEAALRESQAQLQTIVENLDAGVVVSDLDGRLLHWNRAALVMHGFTRLEEAQHRLSDFAELFELRGMDGTVWPVQQWPLARILRGEHLHQVEVSIRRRQTDWQRVYSYSGALVRDTSGRPLLAVVTLSDITARQQAEDALRYREAWYRAIARHIPGGVVVLVDREQRVLVTEGPQLAALGLSREGTEGRPVGDLFPPALRPRLEARYRRALAGKTRHYEDKYPGGVLWTQFVPLRDDRGTVVAAMSLSQDITDQKRAEAALRESEERFRVAQELSPDGFSILRPVRDADGRVVDFTWVYANPATERIVARSMATLAGRRLLELFPGHRGSPFLDAYRQVANTGRTCIREALYQGNGALAERWFRIAVVATGQDIAVLSQDITARKQAEAALHRSEERLRLAQQVARIGSFEWNLQTNVTEWSRELEVLYGLPTGGYSRSYEAWAALVHPDDLPEVERRLRESLDTGQFETEWRIVWPDGTLHWVVARGQVFQDDAGNPLRMVGVNLDITVRKQAEEALRQSREDLDRAQAVGQIGWWRLDTRKNVLTWSPENHRIFGVPEGTPMSYEFFLSIVHPDDRQYVDTQWQAGLRGEPYDIEHRLVADGKVKWVREKAYLEFDGEGQLLGGFGITQDITARKEAEEALRASERRLIGVLESMPDAFVSFDADLRYTYVNVNAERLQAARREDLLGKDVRVVYPDAESYKTIRQYERVFREQKPVTLTSFHVGFNRWVEIRAFPTPDGVSVFYKDVSAQVEAEEALRASEEKYRNLFENMAEEVHFWQLVRDEAGNIKTWRLVDVNPPALKTWGRQSVEEIRGKTTDEIFGPAATEHYLPVVQEIFTKGVPYAFEDYFPNLDKHFRFTSVPFGEYFITTGADITPIKKAQEALRRSEARWNAAIESFAEGAIIATEDEQVIYWNPAAREMHGFTRPDEGIEPLEKTPLTFQLWTPDGRHQLELDEWPMRRIQRGETIRHLELRIRRLDQGWEKVFSYSGTRVATAGGEHLIFLTCHDLTELRQAEQALREREARLQAIVHAVPDVLLVLDAEGRYLEVLTDPPSPLYPDPTALKGRRISDVLPAAVAQVGLTAIRQTLSTRRPQRFEYELAIEKADQRAFEARTAALEVPLSEKPAVVLLARDVTQQRLTEASLRQAQKMEAVGQLTGGLAHDFNNLLAVILGNLELLAEALQDPALADLVHRALEATERGARLILRLLAFARKQPLQAKAVDLNRLVAGMSDLLQRTLGETIQVETVLAADLAQTVIDPGQFETALLNLAVNARDAMPTGGRLTIETANCTLAEDDPRTQRYPVSSGPYAMLAISDTGGGMSPEVAEHAVEPFFTTKAVGQGSGLGLSMVYGLVKQLGGHLQLYSELHQGTTVRMYLPAVPTAPDTAQAVPPSEVVLSTGQGQLILVVEDEAPVRRLAVRMLQSLGYQTLEAETAATALELLETTPQVALLFTDVVLPGGQSGVELAQEARRRWPDLKVLFTSGYTEAHLTQLRPSLADSQLLSKPYRKAQLADQVHALLGMGQHQKLS